MSQPVATWVVKNCLGVAVGQRSIYRTGEQPEGVKGEPSDDGAYLIVIEDCPPDPEPEPRPGRVALKDKQMVIPAAVNLERAIEVYRVHGKDALPVFWSELPRGQQNTMGRFVNDMLLGRTWKEGDPPPIVRLTRLVVECVNGVSLTSNKAKYGRRYRSR